MFINPTIEDQKNILTTPNSWSEVEYSPLKLLFHTPNVISIFDLLSHKNGNCLIEIPPPISIELHLTNNCNLECSWCVDKKNRESGETISKEYIFKTFDYCAENSIGVTLEGGGEPTLHKDFEEIVSYGASLGIHMGLFSNGVLNFKHVLRHFKWIRISLDSSNSEEYIIEKGKDHFVRVLENLKDLAANRNPDKTYLGIGYVLTSRNMSNIVDLMEILNNIGIDFVYFRPVEEAPHITPQINQLLYLDSKLKRIEPFIRIKYILKINDRFISKNDHLPCVAHLLTSLVYANGNVAVCEKRRHDPIILGNIIKDPFEKIWNSAYHKYITKKLCDASEQGGCSVCRMTAFNKLFFDLIKAKSILFI